MTLTIYECHEPTCPMGTRTQPGRFTGGATAGQVLALTGQPELTDDGVQVADDVMLEGVCPGCGTVTAATDDVHEAHAADGDPLEQLHQQVHAMVLDPDNPTTKETAQAVLNTLAREAVTNG